MAKVEMKVLSSEVLQTCRANGAGWQNSIDAALNAWLCTHSPV